MINWFFKKLAEEILRQKPAINVEIKESKPVKKRVPISVFESNDFEIERRKEQEELERQRREIPEQE